MMTGLFNTVEVLAGTYPDKDTLRNAIYAIINGDRKPIVNPIAIKNVEHLARSYEHVRKIRTH
jgi:hypothetical protein